MRTIVAAVVMATTLGAVSTADAVTKRPVRPVAFSAEAEFGQAVPILRHGPMTLFLLCDNGLTRAGTGEPIDVASLFVRSKMDDMLVTGERNRPVPGRSPEIGRAREQGIEVAGEIGMGK